MAVWMARAGRHGEDESAALEQGMAIIGFLEFPDLSGIRTKEQLAELAEGILPGENANRLANWAGQLWAFRERIQPDDFVVLPLRTRSAIAIGQVTGPYRYEAGRHTRPVHWLKTDIPRSAFDPDLLSSFGALMTVCQISRNHAENRIRALAQAAASPTPSPGAGATADAETVPVDLGQSAEDRIRQFIEQKFKGHGLSRIVNAVLEATGYTTQVSRPGPDGGVDIIAGRGAMGFETPRLCVQVKSGSGPVGVEVLRGLHGTMKAFGAELGLLVSWGGFKETVGCVKRSV
jgi:restriction system protein